ncbi:MAG TPA: hypothetical protein VM286_09635 [Candidatus Thermoplasmatota archaeon]|nr:hypothetical protein [Candidatus Thermoplasmatota archaeon]
MTFLHPDDGPDVAYEFFAPFAHVPGKYEWCRIRSATHGVFDTFIVLGASTQVPATVYVNSALGARFMQDRYPECTTHRVQPSGLTLAEAPDGRSVTGTLQADAGPVRKATMTIRAPGMALPKAVPYGGEGAPVWGSRWTCWGVDLTLEAAADGSVEDAGGRKHLLRAVPAILSLGSFGRLAPRATQAD